MKILKAMHHILEENCFLLQVVSITYYISMW